MIFDEIFNFAVTLTDIGMKHNLSPLTTIAEQLKLYSDSFDIENVEIIFEKILKLGNKIENY